MQRAELASQLAQDLGRFDARISSRRGMNNPHRIALLLEAVERFRTHANADHITALADVFTRRPDGKFDLPPVERLAKKLR